MNNITPFTPSSSSARTLIDDFEFGGVPVRVVIQGGEPWFVLADVCRVLEIGNSRDAAARLDEDEKDDVGIIDTIGRVQKTTTISESGLYSLILTSRKPTAKAFKKWITSNVIPSIRKTGGYGGPNGPMADLNDPGTMRGLLLTYCEKVLALEERVSVQTPKVEAFDRIAGADGMMNLTQAAKALQVAPRKLTEWMAMNRWIYRHAGGKLAAYQDRINSGYLAHKCATVQRADGTDKEVWNIQVTAAGLAKLAVIVPDAKRPGQVSLDLH